MANEDRPMRTMIAISIVYVLAVSLTGPIAW
jgi:hypothetical protein